MNATPFVSTLRRVCEVVLLKRVIIKNIPLTRNSQRCAAQAGARHGDTLYSEDLQDGQMFEGRLTVMNPFFGL